ncbi:MAG TPA: LamG domain-containing protein, partial [Verrucomicrobiota bacterium]|nr:LamG domain-containing protein [Verrucomicrobiota bacterium]
FTATNNGSPQLTGTPYGNAVLFNGLNDGLTLGTNPIAGATSFTVEMIFRPDPITQTNAWQPRIFHIQSHNPPDHRFTLEARITNGTWHADVFLRTSASASLTLIDPAKTHPLGQWHHLAATFDGATFRSYVNGVLELSGNLAATQMVNGISSIGMRANKVNFFEGAIHSLRFTRRVLATNEFMNVPVTVLKAPVVQEGNVNVDFALTSGLPAQFKLLHADDPSGPWSTNENDVLITNQPGASYRFTSPLAGDAEFYRVQSE